MIHLISVLHSERQVGLFLRKISKASDLKEGH